MGHKKRNLAPRSKQSSPITGPQSIGVGIADVAAPTLVESDLSLIAHAFPDQVKIEPSFPWSDGSAYSSIKLECERALNALRRGNHNKALRLMKESCAKHEISSHSALIHRVQGTVCVKVAQIMDDPSAKQRHLRNAIESARKAVELSPNSIEFSHFYANLLYEAANDGKEYEEVVQECERALSIESPIDPAKESLQDESQQKISSAEARIAHVQNELRQLIQKSNIASLSTWMKNLGNGEEKFRLIPIRRPTEDPMEVRLIQTRRPNEIKKATKTPEERRKEIEVRVAAARLLQQKSESNQSQNEGGSNDRGTNSSSGSGQRVGDKRRYGMRKNGSNSERKDWVWSYWNSMSGDMKKDLLRVRVADLKSHFGSSKDTFASEFLSEALSFAEANKSWKFWACCRCNQKHSDKEFHMQHVIEEHMGILLPKMQRLVPQNVENEWVEMLLNHSFKPLDLSAATKMVENLEKRKGSNLSEDSRSDYHNEEYHCFKDAWDSYPEKGSMEQISDIHTLEINDYTEIPEIACRECAEDQSSLAYLIADGWPVSDDTDRAKLLEKIHGTFEVLIGHKVLAASHLNKVIQLAMDELQTHPSAAQLLNNGLDRTPLCICLLGAEQLKKIHKYLQELSLACGLGRYPEKGSSPTEDLNLTTQGQEIKEKIVLSEDALYLLLDEGLPSIVPGVAKETSSGDVTSATSPFNVSSDSDALLSWIFSGSSSDDQLASWMRTKEDKIHQGVEIMQMLEKEFYHLQSLCEKKCERKNYEEGLLAVEDLYLAEGKRKEMVTELGHPSIESVLRKRREELIESENDMLYVSTRFELDAISNVLQEAEASNINQYGYEEAYNGMTSQFCDLESGEEDWRAKDYMHQVDISVGTAIQKQKEHLSLELCKIDARIMRNMTGMKDLELKLEPVSAYDYQTVILPMLKSFLRARLEDMAEKDATQKSDAAREAFLAELALDSKKVVRGGNGNLRHMQEKSKDKKKNKDQKKIRDSKVMSGQEQTEINSDISNSHPAVPTVEYPDSESFISTDTSHIEKLDEETRRKIELEEEEKKLEETLELQRRIENEAKQKHLAEQHKKFSQIHSENERKFHDALSKPSADGLDFSEPLKPFIMAELLMENGFSNNQENAVNNTANGSTVSVDCSVDSDLSNGGVPEDGLLLADRRSGKRNRRHRNTSKLVDEKVELVSSGNQNSICPRTHGDGHLQERVVEENGTKSLRELQVEDDEEERFQADIKRALRQSLDTYQAHQKFPVVTRPRTHPRTSAEADEVALSTELHKEEVSNEEDVLGMGLKNEVGEYNCFLNVIIQSLWHLRQFRNEFLRRSTTQHVHVGDPCVVCALYEIIAAMSNASKELRREAIAPTSLRIALSNLYPDSNFFQEAQMNDASEVLAVIFDCLHQSFTRGSSVSDTDLVEGTCKGSWDCSSNSCIVHSLFGMNIYERMNCYHCGLESRHLKYTSFFHNINASALRTMKVMCAENNYDELLNLVEMNHQLACDPEVGGCGKLNYIHHFLSKPPHVFTTVLGWQNTCESAEDIMGTLAALSREIDISVLYRGLDPKRTHNLVSVVCYYGQHYHCFAYSHDYERWVMYDDKTVRVIGEWSEVVTMCEKGHLQPQVLFFESVE